MSKSMLILVATDAASVLLLVGSADGPIRRSAAGAASDEIGQRRLIGREPICLLLCDRSLWYGRCLLGLGQNLSKNGVGVRRLAGRNVTEAHCTSSVTELPQR